MHGVERLASWIPGSHTGLALLACLVIVGCKTGGEAPKGLPSVAADFEHFGGGVHDVTKLTPVGEIVARPADFDGKEVVIKGMIASVCPSSGCFFHLAAGSASIKVDLKSSGFTLPPGKNIGRVAYAQGIVRNGALAELVGHGVLILGK